MAPVFKADAPVFIWLIVGIFWVVSQLAGAAAKKKQPPRPVRPGNDSETPPEDPFAELLRKLGEAQRMEAPKPVYEELTEEPEPLPVPQPVRHVRNIENLPDIQPLRHEEPAPEPEPKPPQVEIPVRPTMKSFRNSFSAMKLPAVNLSFQGLEKTGGKVPTIGRVIGTDGRQSLRRAMLSHIVFSPPKALE